MILETALMFCLKIIGEVLDFILTPTGVDESYKTKPFINTTPMKCFFFS